MQLLRRVFFLVILLTLGCAAQSPGTQDRFIEHYVRSTYPNLPPAVQINIGARKPSEFPNYDALTVTLSLGSQKQDLDYMISKDGKSLIRMTKVDLSQDPYATLMAKINVQGRPVRGNKDAKVTIISFDDFQCPYCSRMHQQLFTDVFGSYADRVRVIYKDFPLPMHNWAVHAAVDANCLAAQNNDAYWELADYIHNNADAIAYGSPAAGGGQPRPRPFAEQLAALDKATLDIGQKRQVDMTSLQACVKAQKDDAVRASTDEGEKLGIDGTPTLFINGERIGGMVPADQLRQAIDRALREAGQPLPPPSAPSAVKPAAAPR